MVKNKTLRASMLEVKIVYCLFENKQGITIKSLAEKIKSDYKNTHQMVNKLFKRGVIKKEKIGNYNICRLNEQSEEVVQCLKEYTFYIKLKEFKKRYSVEYGIIKETIEKVKEEITPFFICLVFGSYAREEEKKSSDIDILFITSFRNKKARKILNRINAPYQRKFHLVEQDIGGFVKDLKNKDKLSIATELYKNLPIVFYGEDIFFKMMVGL